MERRDVTVPGSLRGDPMEAELEAEGVFGIDHLHTERTYRLPSMPSVSRPEQRVMVRLITEWDQQSFTQHLNGTRSEMEIVTEVLIDVLL